MTDSNPTPRRTDALIGRDRDLALLDDFAEQVRTNGAALLVTGDPGMGKTAMLDEAARRAQAAGICVVRVAGRELASQARFAALDQLLAARYGALAQLSPNYRQALTIALGMGDGPTPSRLVLANAALELLRWPTSESTTLVVVDDLQWLDPASADVLAVVARRLSGTTIGFLGASRPNVPTMFATAGLPEHQLIPIADGHAERLVRATNPSLADSTLRRVLVEAQGNPLALIELANTLLVEQMAAAGDLPPLLPVSRRLSAIYASQLDDLPSSSRDVLLLVALESSGELGTLSRASRPFGGLDQLAPAETAGIVTLDSNSRRLTFRHPLARATVVGRSTDIERRRAHRVLADALDDQPDRRVWHLASACTHPDEEVATLLETVGRARIEHGDGPGATAALMRAAELSETHSERGRRLIHAAYISAVVTGQLQNAAKLLEAAHDATPDATNSLRPSVAAANLMFNVNGEVEAARELLAGALLRHAADDTSDDDAVYDALYSLFTICWHAGRRDLWEQLNALLEQRAQDPPNLLALCSATAGDPVHQALPVLGALDAACADLHQERDPVVITRTAIASIYVDRVGQCREALGRVVRDGRQGGAVAPAISALLATCVDDWLTGQWDEALELAHEGIALSKQYGFRGFTEILIGYIRPLILVVRGQSGALVDVERMVEWASHQGIELATTFAHQVQTLSAGGAEDFEAAYHHATAISPAGVLAPYTPNALWVLLDVVESAARTDRMAQAAAHVKAMREADVGNISPRLALVLAGAAAIAEEGDEATSLYRQALAIPGRGRWPFDLARIELCFGEHLRRRQDLVESRTHLLTAADLFERLEAEPWVARAHRGLRATGLARSASTLPAAPDLTAEELEIAQLAASGLSNKQIAQRLYLSHRTVGAHLYRVFPKLGVATRAGLRDALDSLPPKAPDSGLWHAPAS